MTSLNDLNNLTPPAPRGWEAGAQIDGGEGYVTTPPTSGEPPSADEWEHVFKKFNIDPEKYMIDGPVRHSAWDVPNHGVQHAYRARIVERPDRSFNVEELIESIGQVKTLDIDKLTGDRDIIERSQTWLSLQIGDTHIGKSKEAGAGSDYLVAKWITSVTDAINTEVSNAIAQGWMFGGIHIAFLGDLIEGIVSQNGKAAYENDLTVREQERVARHLVRWTIKQAIHFGVPVIVSAVPGNHGETTRQFNTPIGDSADIDIVRSVQEAFDLAGYNWHTGLNFLYPKHTEGYLTYDVGDTTFTVVHGHKFSGKMNGAEKWWSGMSVNGREPGRAQIMLAGHFHSMQISNFTKDKWIVFSPALENQSTWFAEKTGTSSLAGVLTFHTDDRQVPYNFTLHSGEVTDKELHEASSVLEWT